METTWISVKDRLPENSKEVLINLKGSGVFMANLFDRKHWYIFYCDTGRNLVKHHQGSVTHWMELPKPPVNE